METRLVLSDSEATALCDRLTFLSTAYVRDEYTGEVRIRMDATGIKEKEYKTPVSGVIHRFSSRCELEGLQGIWFEFKWTANTRRFEIEFENGVPDEFSGRESVPGWDILQVFSKP